MKHSFLIASLAAVCLTLSSCVTKKQFTDLQSNYNKLQSENASYRDSVLQLAQSRATVRSLEDRLADEQKRNAELRTAYAAMQGSLDKSLQQNSQTSINISKLVDEINASNRYIKQLVEAKSKSDSLHQVITANLTRSLNRDELSEVDVKVLKGVLYLSLADNMLYKSGSYEINDRAAETLSKIAKIIKDYRDYDVLIEGNTDNVPVNASAASFKNIRNN